MGDKAADCDEEMGRNCYMMRDEIVEILLHAGIPAGVKGFTYIHDALDLLDTDPYYITGKVSALYESVAKMNQTTAAQVERAMRHAFETALTRGQAEQIERYLDPSNGQNSNQIKHSIYAGSRSSIGEFRPNRSVICPQTIAGLRYMRMP